MVNEVAWDRSIYLVYIISMTKRKTAVTPVC